MASKPYHQIVNLIFLSILLVLNALMGVNAAFTLIAPLSSSKTNPIKQDDSVQFSVSVSEAWSSCDWYLNDVFFCQQTSSNVADGAVINCLAEDGGVDGGTYDDDKQCKLRFSSFQEHHSGDWEVRVSKQTDNGAGVDPTYEHVNAGPQEFYSTSAPNVFFSPSGVIELAYLETMVITCYATKGIPDATDFTWYEGNTLLRDGELSEIIVDPYEDEYGSHEVRQTLTWTAGNRDDSFELGCKAESDDNSWDDTWAVADIWVTEEGAGDKSKSGDDGLEGWEIALIVIACVILLLIILILIFLYCTGRLLCGKDKEKEEDEIDRIRKAELARMRELDEARERSVQRQRKHFNEGGNDSSSRSSSEETVASSHDAVLELQINPRTLPKDVRRSSDSESGISSARYANNGSIDHQPNNINNRSISEDSDFDVSLSTLTILNPPGAKSNQQDLYQPYRPETPPPPLPEKKIHLDMHPRPTSGSPTILYDHPAANHRAPPPPPLSPPMHPPPAISSPFSKSPANSTQLLHSSPPPLYLVDYNSEDEDGGTTII